MEVRYSPQAVIEVLLVDDSALVRAMLGDELEDAGYAVRKANDGREAILMIEERCPRVVVTDAHMPNMDGFELAARLQTALPNLALVLLTGDLIESEQARAHALGLRDIVVKSNDPSRLLDVIARIVAENGRN